MPTTFGESTFTWCAAILVASFGLSAVLVGFTSYLARRLRFVDRPNPNTGNPGGAALGGGVAIVVTIVTLAFCFVDAPWGYRRVMIPLGAVCLLGLWDDLQRISPLIKVIGQAICAFMYTTLAGLEPQWIMPIVAFLILASNSWNVVDVMDSLLGWIGLMCLFGVVAVLIVSGHSANGLTGVALLAIGSIAGFLMWNSPPAKVLMGDGGSLALGMLYGIFVVEGFVVNPFLGVTLILPGLIPFLEVGFLIIQRSMTGTAFYRTTPDHFALRMIHNRYSIRQVIRPVIITGIGLSALACLLAATSFHSLVIVGVTTLTLPLILWAYHFFSRLPANGPAAQVTSQSHDH